jgi:CHAT domain-containing protein/tetratricopeptide (TPR) repeat protein
MRIILLILLFPFIGLSNSISLDCQSYFTNAEIAFDEARYSDALLSFKKASNCYLQEEEFDSASIATLWVLETLYEQKNYYQLNIELETANKFLGNLKLPIFEKTQNDHSIKLYEAKVAAGNGRMENAKTILENLKAECKAIINEREGENMSIQDRDWVIYAKKRLIYNYKAIAIIFIEQKAHQTALDYFNQAYDFIELYPSAIKTGSKNSYLTKISNIYLQLNDFKNAKDKLLEAITLLDEVKERKKYEKQAYYQLSEISKKEGKLDSAKHYLEIIKNAYGDGDEDYWKTCYRLAEIDFLNHSFNDASVWINCAIDNLENNSNSNLAEAYLLSAKIKLKQNLLEDAKKELNLGLNKFYNDTVSKEKLIYSITLSEILNLKVNLQLQQGLTHKDDIDQCKKEINQALNILEKFRNNDLYQGEKQDLVNFYYAYFETAMEVAYVDYYKEPSQAKLIEMLEISEQGKAITLMESILEMTAKKKAKVSPELLQKEIAFKNELANIEDQLSKDPSNHSLLSNRVQIKEKVSLLINEISKEFPAYEKLLNTVNQNELKIKESLHAQSKKHDLIIEYFYTAKKIYLISFAEGNLKINMIENSKALENKIIAFRKSIIEKDKTIYKKLGASLFEHLIKPVLHNHQNVLIIPDGPLSLIPFEALLKENSQDIFHYSDLPFIIKEHTVSYTYSLVLQSQLNAIAIDKSKQIFLGINPDFSNDKMVEDLVYNKQEVESIYALIGEKNKPILNFDKNDFLSFVNNYRIIHLATHATVDIENASNSCIAFYNDSLSLLYAKEIYPQTISPEMLVLSACQTGNGIIKKGEGVMSLSRAFLQAGTKSVINSQWNLNDKSGMQIMVDFYANLKSGNPKNKALKKAKLKYLSNPHNDALNAPAFWASFNVIGDVSPIKLKNSLFLHLLLSVLGILGLILSRKYWLNFGKRTKYA